jgi:hypothetical protein
MSETLFQFEPRNCVLCGCLCEPAPTIRGWVYVDNEAFRGGVHYDCLYHWWDNVRASGEPDAVVDALQAEIARLRAENERLRAEQDRMKWVSVKDRLPDEDSVVWGFGRTLSGNQFLGEAYIYGGNGAWYENTIFGQSVTITHWQEMTPPAPPESEVS